MDSKGSPLVEGPGGQSLPAGFQGSALAVLASADCLGCPVVDQFEWGQRVGCGGSCQWTLLSPLWVDSGPRAPGLTYCRHNALEHLDHVVRGFHISEGPA